MQTLHSTVVSDARFPLLFFACGMLLLLPGCSQPDPNRLQGYLEGEFVYVASPLAGSLEKLNVQRGAEVKPGELLFILESVSEKTAREEAERRLVQAHASLEDAKKGKRPTEVASLEAELKLAAAATALSEKELARQEQLHHTGASTQQDLDRARSTHDQNLQKIAQLKADLETARLGQRPDQIAAAEANVSALEAALAKADWNLSQKHQNAPEAAMVFDTLYREGEWVAAGRPVVSLLPPRNIKLRVFVPENRLASIHPGDSLRVAIDGRTEPLTAKVSFVSPRVEYTPPVLYSRDNRSKLVFLVEATFDAAIAATLHPGQPVEVFLNPPR